MLRDVLLIPDIMVPIYELVEHSEGDEHSPKIGGDKKENEDNTTYETHSCPVYQALCISSEIVNAKMVH
jgi:hypothetical protein